VTPARVPPPPRNRTGSTANVQARLAAQRHRPLAIRLYAALLGDAGPLGAPARRRLLGFLLRSLPAAGVVAGTTLVTLRVFEGPVQGPAQLVSLATLVGLLVGVVWRRLRRATHGQADTFLLEPDALPETGRIERAGHRQDDGGAEQEQRGFAPDVPGHRSTRRRRYQRGPLRPEISR
jgi:hypothetical protein